MKSLKSNNGNTGVEIVISIGIITITLSILLAIYFNLYASNTEIERRTNAINYATQIIEKATEYYYSDVTEEKFQIANLENGKKEIVGITMPNGFHPVVEIEPYSDNEQTDVVKKVRVTINYTVFEKTESVTLEFYKTKETLIIPNKPELTTNLVAIRSQSTNNATSYKITNSSDINWYNYSKKIWALAVEKSELDGVIQESDLYVWIPRYAYYESSANKTDIQFLYSDKNQTVNELGNLIDKEETHIVPPEFTGQNTKGYWILVSEIENDETANRLNKSKYGKLLY